MGVRLEYGTCFWAPRGAISAHEVLCNPDTLDPRLHYAPTAPGTLLEVVYTPYCLHCL